MSSSYVTKIGRKQSLLLPEMIDDYIDEDNPTRLFDSFVDSLNLKEMKSMSDKARNAKASERIAQSVKIIRQKLLAR